MFFRKYIINIFMVMVNVVFLFKIFVIIMEEMGDIGLLVN